MRFRSVSALVFVAGCSFQSTAPLDPLENRCRADEECIAGLCDGSICIDATGASAMVAIEVVADPMDTRVEVPASWVFDFERFEGSSVVDLALPATREVRGSVRWEGSRVPATLRFARRMPGSVASLQQLSIDVDTLREPAGAAPDSYDFTTVLVAGETYDVAVVPTSDTVMSPESETAPAVRSLPPLYLELEVRSGEASAQRFDVSFPADLTSECTDDLQTGCTLIADVASFDGEVELAEPGLQVRAVDPVSGRVVSSIGETDLLGTFAIRIGEATTDYLIRVTSSAGRELFPAVSVDPDVVFADDPERKVIRIPRLDPVQYSGRVQDEAGAPVPSATLRFQTNSVFDESRLGLQGSFAASATTNADGTFGAALLPGFYSVTVLPPEDLERTWGVLTYDSLVGMETEPASGLVVPSKVELTGSVQTFADEAAVGATVVARARQEEYPASKHRSQEAVTNSIGRFTMFMDVGLYDISVKVPSTSGYAWAVEPARVVERDATRTYRLDPPIPIEGLVLADQGAVVPNALVRAYLLVSDGTESRPVQVAETSSDEEGRYRLLIAPRPGDG